ncbi:hypothetical protein Q5P01_006883 [Channa striata]|uniref:Uncharacterized protein n=1 Tax=Channa striata TaxID=64152 RepID=A0AA88SXD4_CHASR|nr:hypothetical protein Q5P01_006883 [Channa striata]
MAVWWGGVRGGDKEGEQERGRRAGGEGGSGQRAIEGQKEGGRKGSGEERRKGQAKSSSQVSHYWFLLHSSHTCTAKFHSSKKNPAKMHEARTG